MALRLFEHNEKAYHAAVRMMEQYGKAAIVHPTGTGKSYIAFKLIEDNPEKVVIWLSPSEYIFKTQLESLKRNDPDFPLANVHFYTYAKLMCCTQAQLDDIAAQKPAYIILDEFHRAGAECWGESTVALLKLCPDARLLGLTATNIRYLDNNRDMAEELFDSRVASDMTLGEAIVRGILPAPNYVTTVYQYQKDLARYQTRVDNLRSPGIQDVNQKYLDALRRALEQADGLDMNIILLSGGSGKRLWPLSNDIRSKQFIKIFKKEDGTYESMVQRVYRQIKKVDTDATVTIATSKTQVSAIHNQLGEDVGISVEPCRRDTFPAIALATAYLVDVMHVDPSKSVVVCPVDPYVEDNYFEALKELSEQADKCDANLVLMGIEPTYPSEKYGYIIPQSADHVAEVKTFREKPTTDVAEQYIAQGALWNGGVFAYKLGYVMNKAHELMDFTDYQDLFDKYDTLKKISFDYAVVEHEPKIQVVRFAGMWKDLGTWNTLTEAMDESIIGKGELNDKCSDVHIINEMDVPVLAMGLHDVVISASPEGILVSDKEQSSYIKPFVDKFEQQIMFAEKSWGSFKVVDVENTSLTIKVTLNPGHSMNYHSHKNRDEVWVVISGKGKTVVDGMEQKVKAGDVITMSAGCRHTVMADTELKLIEVQLGEDINVHDKQKFELEY